MQGLLCTANIFGSYTSIVESSKAKNVGKEPNKNPDLKFQLEPSNKSEQVFLDELERLKRQEKDANDAAEALRKEFAQDTEDLLLQAGAAKASSTNNKKNCNQLMISEELILVDLPKGRRQLEQNGFTEIKRLKEVLWLEIRKGFIDPKYPKKVYKVVKALYGLHQDPRAWFQVTPKTSHLNVVNRIFRYLKGKPKMGLWYPRVSSFDLEAYSDSDYAGANLDRKSTIRVFHSKTKHIAIRHHFIQDAYEKKLIQVLRIHTDDNVADLLTKAFDVSSSIHYALTISPVVSTTFVEQFWMSAKSKIINNVRYITAKVAGKPVSISEASIRSDLLFDDADGIDSLPNQAIFDAIQLMGLDEECIHEAKIGGKEILEVKPGYKRSESNHQGRKSDQSLTDIPHKDLALISCRKDDKIDYMETEDAQDVGRTRYVVHEEKESAEKEVSTEDALSTAQPKVSTDKPEVSTERPDEDTDKQKVSTDKEEVSTDRPDEGLFDKRRKKCYQKAPTTLLQPIFGDDDTNVQVLIIMSQNKEKLKEKEKGVELKDIEETERPRPTSTRSLLTLKPLPKIDPKDKGKKKIKEEDESDTESEGITEAEKKFKQLARDEEVARKARLNADKILAEKLQEEEREMYIIEQRAKLLHDTIAAQRRFLAQQRNEAIRNKPPSRNHLRNQMMTYLKHVGGKKHSDLKAKTFEEIQVLYERLKRQEYKL
ncbi:hypothetical protein Tco_0150744 [Tanacetum coccineum]